MLCGLAAEGDGSQEPRALRYMDGRQHSKEKPITEPLFTLLRTQVLFDDRLCSTFRTDWRLHVAVQPCGRDSPVDLFVRWLLSGMAGSRLSEELPPKALGTVIERESVVCVK